MLREGAAVITSFHSVEAGGRRWRWWRRRRRTARVMSRIRAFARRPHGASDVFEHHAALFNTVRSISRRRKGPVGEGQQGGEVLCLGFGVEGAGGQEV